MNIDSLVRTAVERIKSNWGLPEHGFIAGGSIANIVWELVSENKAVVNDVDVFIFDGLISEIDDSDKSLLYKYQERETKFWEDYTGMRYGSVKKDFYTIISSEHDGMFNKVKYKSNKIDTDLILRSFDINATKVGYSVEEDKVYWTPEFEEFLNTGELKVCNLMTPAHTVIRVTKKRDELNCKLDYFEIKLIKHAIGVRFNDVFKLRFKSRYFEMFEKYSDSLSKDFDIKRDTGIEDYVRLNFNEDTQIYYLEPKYEEKMKDDDVSKFIYGEEVFVDDNIRKIHNSFEFLFYMRNIWNKDNLPQLWEKLHFFFNDDISYIDCQPTPEDLELMSRIGKYAPNSIDNLKGLKLSQQISLVKNVLQKFEDDPIVGISILEKHKLEGVELNTENLLLLELSVRKQIVNDTKGKVNKVLGKKEIKEDSPLNNPDWWN
jgi:hypothetical protein